MRCVGLALVVLYPMAAGADGLAVAPAVVAAEVDADGPLPPVTIANQTGEPWECVLAVRPLGQALDGTARPAPESYPFSAHALVTIAEPRFVIAPGDKAVVVWRAARPARAGGAYALLEVKGRPVGRDGPWTSAAAELRLTFPGSARAALAAGRIDAGQDRPGGAVTLSARVANHGDAAAMVGAVVSATDATGKIVAEVTLGPAWVLPAFERTIAGTLAAPPPGAYRLAGTAACPGGASAPVAGALEVLRPGEIATHRAALVGGGPDVATAGAPIHLQAIVENRGNLPLPATGRVRLVGDAGESAATLAPPSPIPVGRRATLAGIAPALPAGDYQVEVWVENPAGRPLAAARRTLRVGDAPAEARPDVHH